MSQALGFQPLEVMLSKQKLKICRRCQINDITILDQNYIVSGHEYFSMQKLTLNTPFFNGNFQPKHAFAGSLFLFINILNQDLYQNFDAVDLAPSVDFSFCVWQSYL